MKHLNQRIILEKTLLHSIKNGILLYDEKEKAKQLHRIINKANKNQRKGLAKMMVKIKDVKAFSGLWKINLDNESHILVTDHEKELLFSTTYEDTLHLDLRLKGSDDNLYDPVFNEVEYSDDPIECIGFIKL